MSRPEIVLDVTYPCPVERVWATLTDRRALAQWLLPNDFAPQLGHRFTFTGRTPGDWPQEVACEVVALQPLRRLAFTWQDDPLRPPTLVQFTLEAVPGGTRLRLEHGGFAEAIRGRAAYRRQRELWQRLPRLLQLRVDAAALTDELLAFLHEPRAATRNALPVLAELCRGDAPGVKGALPPRPYRLHHRAR